MARLILLAYQLLTGVSDTSTGVMLLIAPELVQRLVRQQAPPAAAVYLSFVGALVLPVGLACLYGAYLVLTGGSTKKLAIVWLLTAFTRASVAIFVVNQILASTLASGWLAVAAADGACVLVQAIGLRRGWIAAAAAGA